MRKASKAPNVVSSKQTTTQVDIELSSGCLVELLRAAGHIPDGVQVGSVFVRVPGGADWSHCDLDISEDTPVVVRYTTEERSVVGKIK